MSNKREQQTSHSRKAFVLLLLVPLSIILRLAFPGRPIVIFFAAAGAIVPLSGYVSRATEQLARHVGQRLGGLLNITFGNVTEIILALYLLSEGRVEIVKAQITGSIIAGGLLGLGLAIFLSCLKDDRKRFNRYRASQLSSLLLLSLIALAVPAVYDLAERRIYPLEEIPGLDFKLSFGVAIILIGVYAANLVYMLVTHRDMFNSVNPAGKPEEEPRWGLRSSVAVLFSACVFVAVESEIIAGSAAPAAAELHVSMFFLGITLISIIGAAAEIFTAISFARQNMMDLAVGITAGGAIQMALFIAPLLVLMSYFTAHRLTLVFSNPLELAALGSTAFAVSSIARDGEVTWFKGLLLMAVYGIFAVSFFFFRA